MEIEIPSLILINAPQGSGKSHLIRYIMWMNRKKFDVGLVFCNTFFEDDSFDYIDKKNKLIHPEYDEKVLKNLMKIQAEKKEEGETTNAFVIFDDCIDAKQFQSPVLKNLCTQLRHYNITVIFSTQYANIIPTWMRANAMTVIMFKTDTESNLRALYESYGQSFGTFNDFKSYFFQNLGDYKFIYYNKKDPFKIMKAPKKIPKFKLKFNIEDA